MFEPARVSLAGARGGCGGVGIRTAGIAERLRPGVRPVRSFGFASADNKNMVATVALNRPSPFGATGITCIRRGKP